MLQYIAITKKLEEENLVQTRRHSSSLASWRFLVPRCSCTGYYHRCTRLGCPKALEWVKRFPGMAKFWEGMVYRNKCDSLDENKADYSKEAVNNLDKDSEKQLRRSGRGYRGFNFGGAHGGWRKMNWGNLGGLNNGNNGGFWNRGLPGVGLLLFGNRAGSSTPPHSDSLPDLSTGGLSAQHLNICRRPSAMDLTRTTPAVHLRNPSTATLVDVTPNLPSVLPSRNMGSALTRMASQEVASLTGTLPETLSAALTRTRGDIYMPMLRLLSFGRSPIAPSISAWPRETFLRSSQLSNWTQQCSGQRFSFPRSTRLSRRHGSPWQMRILSYGK